VKFYLSDPVLQPCRLSERQSSRQLCLSLAPKASQSTWVLVHALVEEALESVKERWLSWAVDLATNLWRHESWKHISRNFAYLKLIGVEREKISAERLVPVHPAPWQLFAFFDQNFVDRAEPGLG